MDRDSGQVCYSSGCDNYANIALKLPLGPRIQCIIYICETCLPKYQLDDSDKLQHEHQMAIKCDNGSGATK